MKFNVGENKYFGEANVKFFVRDDAAPAPKEEESNNRRRRRNRDQEEAKPEIQETPETSTSSSSLAKVATTPKRVLEDSPALKLRKKIRDAVQGSISLDQLEKIRLLGEGEFGEVWMVAADVFQTGLAGRADHRVL